MKTYIISLKFNIRKIQNKIEISQKKILLKITEHVLATNCTEHFVI